MRPEVTSIAARVREIVSAAGIDNFHMEEGVLVMCGVRYMVERCGCDDPQCNGIRLEREDGLGDGNFFAVQ